MRGGFVDPYGRPTSTVAIGETIFARLHIPGTDDPTRDESHAFRVRDLVSYDSESTSLDDPPVADIYEGGTLATETGAAVEDDHILQTAVGRQIQGRYSHVVGQVLEYATVTASRTALVDAVGRARIALRPGQTLHLEVFDVEASGTTIVVLDAGTTLDQETVTLSDAGGGLFRGSIATGSAAATAEDGVLDLAAGGETLTASHADGDGGSTADLTTLPEPTGRSALLVVGSVSLGAGDQAVHDRLTGQGWSVTVIDDGASSTTDALGHDLVLISSTVTSNKVGSKFRVAVPVLVWEPYVLDDMGMTGTNAGLDFGSEAGQTEVTIRDASHPLSAGFEGTVSVSTASGNLTYGRPGHRAHGVARVGSRPERLSILGHEQGDVMAGHTAPARRVSTFLSDTTAASLTADGWALVDAAVCWATPSARRGSTSSTPTTRSSTTPPRASPRSTPSAKSAGACRRPAPRSSPSPPPSRHLHLRRDPDPRRRPAGPEPALRPVARRGQRRRPHRRGPGADRRPPALALPPLTSCL